MRQHGRPRCADLHRGRVRKVRAPRGWSDQAGRKHIAARRRTGPPTLGARRQRLSSRVPATLRDVCRCSPLRERLRAADSGRSSKVHPAPGSPPLQHRHWEWPTRHAVHSHTLTGAGSGEGLSEASDVRRHLPKRRRLDSGGRHAHHELRKSRYRIRVVVLTRRRARKGNTPWVTAQVVQRSRAKWASAFARNTLKTSVSFR